MSVLVARSTEMGVLVGKTAGIDVFVGIVDRSALAWPPYAGSIATTTHIDTIASPISRLCMLLARQEFLESHAVNRQTKNDAVRCRFPQHCVVNLHSCKEGVVVA